MLPRGRGRWGAALLALMLLPALGLGLPAGAAAPVTDIHPAFAAYYAAHEGLRVLGHPLTGVTQVGVGAAQYFEKGRIEDHRFETLDPTWAFMYGRLGADLLAHPPAGGVSGTSLTYAALAATADPGRRVAPPAGFTGGTTLLPGGQAVFVPLDPWLRPAPGYAVPTHFWAYITRADLFPGGWLHDVGLPLTPVLPAQVVKQGVTRTVQIQAFERAVLSYDPLNPAEWQVERANIGSDYLPLIARPAGLQIPEAGARVLLPVHLLARFAQAGQAVSARLRWADGTTLTNQYTLLPGEDGTGLLVGNLDWVNALAPPEPPTQAATLAILDASGAVLFQRSLTVVNPHDPGTQTIQLYWTISGSPDLVQPQQRVILATPRVATAALEELLWGPPAISQVGFRTALPLPGDVLQYLGRTPEWGPRVTLRGVTIVDGVATANFSRELNAYGGGSTRVRLITAQVTQTLLQFPTVHSVRFAIEGQLIDGLQP